MLMKTLTEDQIQSMLAVFHVRTFSDILHTDSCKYEDVTLCSGHKLCQLHDCMTSNFRRLSFLSLALDLYWRETYSWGKV
jgi:hypothetical protein